MKIKHKLPLAFACVLALLSVAALIGIFTLRHSLQLFSQAVQQHVANERAVRTLEAGFKTQVQEWKNTLLRGADEAQRQRYWKAFQTEEAEVARLSAQLIQQLGDGQAKALVAQFQQAHVTMGQGYRAGFSAFTDSGFQAAAGDKSVSGMDREPSALLEKAGERIARDSAEVADGAKATAQSAFVLSLGLMAVVAAVGLVVGVLFSRTIVDPLDAAVGMAEAVAGGDLTQQVHVRGRDETAALLRSLQVMQMKLSRIVVSVRDNAHGVSLASSEIAQGNLDLSSRTEEQASALEETAASMDELGATTRNNADNAARASALAQGASDVAAQGGRAVGEVVSTMQEIRHSSSRVSDIIGVIDGIAFQTNILALNAAVEAARAGEQGRGFAVVASEVRALAQRSAAAAKEIKGLIEASVNSTQQGSVQVDAAGKTIDEIVQSITEVAAIVREMSIASKEQSLGVAQAGEAITQIDRVTQQNAALVEESASAAASLDQQAKQLVQEVAFFKLAASAA
ncbi:MAG: HAMP domain-containing protein [Comamonadaceae bacterium]|nr:MAG: HAMP domain-containing protein [Comamonadaceae bacterium]